MSASSMLSRTSLVRAALRRASPARVATRQFASPVPSKQANSAIRTWYNIFGSSTAGYATWLVFGIVVGEFLTGKFTDTMWRQVNYGKTFDTVDWSKFDPEDEDEDEDDDDDE